MSLPGSPCSADLFCRSAALPCQSGTGTWPITACAHSTPPLTLLSFAIMTLRWEASTLCRRISSGASWVTCSGVPPPDDATVMVIRYNGE